MRDADAYRQVDADPIDHQLAAEQSEQPPRSVIQHPVLRRLVEQQHELAAPPRPHHATLPQYTAGEHLPDLFDHRLGHCIAMHAGDLIDVVDHHKVATQPGTRMQAFHNAGLQSAPVGQTGERVAQRQRAQLGSALAHDLLQLTRTLAVRLGVEMRTELVANALQHLGLIEGFGQEIARPALQRAFAGQSVVLGSEHDHRRHGQLHVFTDQQQHIMTAQIRHADVEQDERGRGALDLAEHLTGVGQTGQVLIAGVLEYRLEQTQVCRVVIDDEDARPRQFGFKHRHRPRLRSGPPPAQPAAGCRLAW